MLATKFRHEEDIREVKILKFIKQNPGSTTNQVVKYMDKNGSSKITTLKKIDDLIDGKRLRDEHDKPNGFHKLFYDDNNDFDLINNQLTKIEKTIDVMDKPLRKIQRLLEDQQKELSRLTNEKVPLERRRKFVSEELYSLQIDYQFTYLHMIDIMFHVLSLRIDERIHSDKDLQILYAKIIELMRKVSKQFPRNAKFTLDGIIDYLGEFTSKKDIRIYAQKHNININLISDVIHTVENFKNEFLVKER
ncbi:MAG: hypothetical protein ACM3XP_00410 [Nitrososphaerales archaeon]